MAGCYDRSWSSKARGTRSQFRLNTEGLLPFKCTYPVHVMDAVPSTQSDLRRGELVSPPVRGTRTRAVREYEQTIEELTKENFDLKLRIFLLEENINKNYLKNKVFSNEDQDNTVQVNVELQGEAESLKKQLSSKDQLLQQALDQAEKCASDLKELQDTCVQQKDQLSSFAKLPSEQEWRSLMVEKEKNQKEIEELLNSLSEKNNEIRDANVQIEELSSQIEVSEAKISKSSLAIQGLAQKYYQDIENIPKDVRPIVQSGVQAAKECKEEGVNAAIVNFKAFLFKLMHASAKEVSYSSLQKENVDPSRSKTSMGENKPEKLKGCLEESSLYHRHSNPKINFVHDDSRENLEKIIETMEENENLQSDNDKKSKKIKELTTNCDGLKQRTAQLQSELSDAESKVKELETKIQNEKSKSKLSDKFLEYAGKSDDIEELKEEILRLILAIEQKDKEIADIKQNYELLQSYLENTDAKDYIFERNELHEHLARSHSVNRELVEHLRKLERFMEDLVLHKKLDSSTLESSRDFLHRLSECLDETKQLSSTVDGFLSVCESSKLFDPEETSKQPQDPSVSTIHPNFPGRNYFQPSDMESLKNTVGTGKRRLSYSTIHNSAPQNTAHMDSENVVVLGTSNNEDLILLLNDKGDPEDVLIRNNHSHLDQNASTFNSGDQLRRRCWESSTMKFWNGEKSTMDQWDNSELLNPEMNGTWFNNCPSSDSDIWSEPDRDVSLQRIGIDVQKSPIAQKSPRRARLRDKRTTDELSSQKNESSSSVIKLHWSKRRKSSDVTKFKDDKSEKERLLKSVDDLLLKCKSQENQLDVMRDMLQSKTLLVETLNEEKLELSNCIDHLKEELNESRKKQNTLTLKSSESKGRLAEQSSENDKLKNMIQELEKTASQSDELCKSLKDELAETKTRLQDLDSKCSKYEKDLSLSLKTKEEYIAKFKSVEDEKTKLSKEIEALNLEKNKLLRSIQLEKESLERKNSELNVKLEESLKSVSSLQQSSKNLENEKNELLKAKEISKSSLLNSYSSCDKLRADLKKVEECLKNTKSQCNVYEEKLSHSSNAKQDFIKSLSSVRSTFLLNLISLTNVCKRHLNCGEGRFKEIDNLLSEKELKTDKDDQIGELFETFISANAKFVQTTAFLSQQLSSIFSTQQMESGRRMEMESEIESLRKQNNELKDHIEKLQQTVQEDKSSIKKYKSEILSMQQELDSVQMSMETLRDYKNEQQTHLEDIQQDLKAKEKSLEESNIKISSTEMQIDNVEQQLKKDQHLLNLKDDEITKLQERIFNLQTQVNNLLSDKMRDTNQIKSLNLDISKLTRASNEFRENSLLTTRVSLDTSLSSIASEKDRESTKNISERYSRKIKALKTKLSVAEKRIEMLEKEKSNLRENLLDQVHEENRTSSSSEEIKAVRNEVAHLKEKLKAKASFIEDLKNDMYRTSNSLVDKEKEVEVLQNKLLSSKTYSEIRSIKSGENDLQNKYSDPLHSTTESNIMMLKKQKWELIEAILKQQKDFYEHRDIHLGHFEKFKNHIEELRTLQVFQTLSGSEPILNSSITANNCYAEKCDRALKNFRIELEIDVEYLQNFKIFLKRFFIPLVLQNFQQSFKPELKNTYSSSIEVVHRISDSESTDRLRTTAGVDISRSPSKQDISDQESLSEETITLSRSGSMSPESFEDGFPPKYFSNKLDNQKEPENHYEKNKENSSELSHKSNITGGSQDSIFQRSHFSSPDLGIESDPNHESSAPEQTEKEKFRESTSIKVSKRQECGSKVKQWIVEKQSRSLYNSSESSTKRQDNSNYAMADTLHAIGVLKHYELLKKEVQESLVGIKAILSRTGDGLQNVSKYTSPRKNFEYSTFKAIKDVSGNIEVCLEEATKLVDKFWIAPCPSVQELNLLIQKNQEQQETLRNLQEAKMKQENNFKEIMAKLEHAELVKEQMEKKISKKLIKTKKVIRRAEIKMLERGGQGLHPIPKYPSEESTCQNKS